MSGNWYAQRLKGERLGRYDSDERRRTLGHFLRIRNPGAELSLKCAQAEGVTAANMRKKKEKSLANEEWE